MATFMPHFQMPQKPHQDLPSNTPPEQSQFQTNIFPQRVPSLHGSNGRKNQHRISGDYRSNGPVPAGDKAASISTGPQPHIPNGGLRPMHVMGGFEGARSPPNTKNTSHVPCKFFKIGQCQAGKACPFSHDMTTSKFETPCKYFAKGNCKFGAKCALAHVLPNGRVVNKPNVHGGNLNIGGRVDPHTYQESILGNSLLAQQATGHPPPFSHQFGHLPDQDSNLLQAHQGQAYNSHFSAMDGGFNSHPDAHYGSPREDLRLAMSPVMHSTLDAPLPASFDSQGISYMARHGPVAASVPSKFGLESPPASLPKKPVMPSDALRNLHDSAFGREMRTKPANMSSSPSVQGDEPSGQRTMHSQRVAKPKMMSSSLPRPPPTDDWDDDSILFGGEEDYVPQNLSHLLNPEEKQRRFSSKEQDPVSIRENLSGNGTPAELSSKVGSPSTASPSRFSTLFAKQKREEESQGASPSAFGHVGSPLRNSSLQYGAGSNIRSIGRQTSSGDVSPHVLSSPPRQSSTSMISQQLQRTKLSRTESGESQNPSGLHPGSAQRQPSRSTSGIDRALSSSSISTSRIDEEQPECVFSLDEEDYNGKRESGTWDGGRSPNLGPIGTGRGSLGS